MLSPDAELSPRVDVSPTRADSQSPSPSEFAGIFILIVPRWEKVFWRPDVKVRAIQSPIWIASHLYLVNLTTGQPPANARVLNLEAWKIRGDLPNS